MTERTTFEEVVLARAPALLRLAVMLTGTAADAEDLLQSTLLKAHRHADDLATMAAPAAYLRKIMVNEHLSAGRLLSRRPRTTGLLDRDVVAPRQRDAEIEERDEMWRLLSRLPRQQRAVLALRYYEDLPDAEIADVLGIREGTVRSHAFRALAALRERLTLSTPPEEEQP